MSSSAMDAYAWFWRVRRDILALEFLSHNNNDWNLLKRAVGATGNELPLPPRESLGDTACKVKKLLAELGYPSDPGDPPMPPFE